MLEGLRKWIEKWKNFRSCFRNELEEIIVKTEVSSDGNQLFGRKEKSREEESEREKIKKDDCCNYQPNPKDYIFYIWV